ncbi:unnamed protein product [Sphagnum troendelagicum]|uniref:Uncharacterized protein n=1 Tax=Sphagnum troendelagicum TaxID=128251 RepID=A0ABP0V287_9BRYO
MKNEPSTEEVAILIDGNKSPIDADLKDNKSEIDDKVIVVVDVHVSAKLLQNWAMMPWDNIYIAALSW